MSRCGHQWGSQLKKGASTQGECTNLEGSHLREEGPTMGRDRQDKQHIKKKTHKPISLRSWVEGGVMVS